MAFVNKACRKTTFKEQGKAATDVSFAITIALKAVL